MGSEEIQRTFWQPVYDQLAAVYDAVDWFTGNTTHRFRLRALPYLPSPPARILEIGFGSGKLHLELAEEYEMAGLDRAAGMARLTGKRLAAEGLASGLCVGSAFDLPWANDYFDAVVSTFAFSALPDAERAMDEMVRVTRPGGRIVIVDAGEADNGNPFAHKLAALWEQWGDYIRDEVLLMEARGLAVRREEFGPWGCVHVVAGMVQEQVGE